jgi:hypothetical protein
MPSYTFLTSEGTTFQPDSESIEPDVENLQVLGFADGPTPDAAFQNLLKENPWLSDTSFTECFSLELAGSTETRHNLRARSQETSTEE